MENIDYNIKLRFVDIKQDGYKLLENVIEMTGNHWEKVKVFDLYKYIVILNDIDNSNEILHIVAKESVDQQKQLEVIHMVQLLRLIHPFELKPFIKELKKEKPNEINCVQPLFEVDYPSENQALLSVDLNNESSLVLFTTGEILNIPIES